MRRLTLTIVTALLLAACGAPSAPQAPAATQPAEQPPAATQAPAPTSAPAAEAPISAPQPTAAPAPAAASGELRIGTGISIPSSLLVPQNAYNMISYGAGETLMRFSPEQQLEPWLAESVERTGELTWRVSLREGVRFHDGSLMTAQDVADSFASSWASAASAATFIPTDTTVLVEDDTTLTFTTPEPQGNFRYSLANWNFIIHKAPVNDISIMTGMYRPVSLVKDQELVLERFAEHWGGGGALERIRVLRIPDANARALALQSGDLDMLTNVPPDIASGLPPEIEQVVVPGTRLHHVMLNHRAAPFDDPRVREAASLAIDRAALLAATLEGRGEVAVNLYPASVGLPLVEAQRTDVERAKQLLDEAGWVAGADGARAKDGQPLAVKLYSYPGRPELTLMAIAIQSMWGDLGITVEVEEVADIVEQIKDGDFQASMYSLGVQADPQYMPAITLSAGAAYNYGGYTSEPIDALVAELRAEDDPAAREALAVKIQEQVGADTPNLYLATPPLITAFRSDRVVGLVPHPNDLYLVTASLAVQ